MSIYKKLHKIQSAILGLGKDKKGNNYEYVTGNKVLSEIKPLMNDLGLLLKQEVISIDNVRQDYATRDRKKEEIEQPKDTILDIPKHLESSKTLEELQNRYLGLSDNDKTKYAALTTAIKAKLIKTIK